jgi:tetratricopeptide (TPR) repeat protein
MCPSSNPVSARVEQRNIPTYPALEPDRNPMFFESRNIQGSKGSIYPNPYIDRLSSDKVDKKYTAVVLENEFLEMVMLPEIGGRIFAGLDKTNGYDFFYRHKVIKPALIGLFGPWISGGVEFNWPQHHRPSTYDPTNFTIEEHADGSKTVWMSEHDPLNRTKGMVGITLYPGKAFVETKVRLYNRTPFPQTFLWWANAGVHINEKYQVIFPPDVHYAVYHVKNPVTAYPISTSGFGLDGENPEGVDVSWWANSPHATSFFAAPSKYEFFGGYDHERGAGVVHVADAGISPGKKFFTWANGPFGHTWQKNLMDDTGEYLELMAGVYTDNQPDFSWIMPHETRSFSQFWFPVQEIGGMKNANLKAAVNLELRGDKVFVGVYAVQAFPGARVNVSARGLTLLERSVDLAPGKPFTLEVPLPGGLAETDLLLRVQDSAGEEIIHYKPEPAWDGQMAEPYKEPPTPAETAEIEQLYLIGLHLEQYRHPTLSPDAYWQEALRRDPGDARSNLAVGKACLRRGLFSQAEDHFRAAVKRLTSWNYNPYDGEAHYSLGLALQYQGRLDEAYKTYYKAAWNYAWQSAAYNGLAQIDMQRGDTAKALDHLERALAVNIHSSKARTLKAAMLRHEGQAGAAEALAAESLTHDLHDYGARCELALAAYARGDSKQAGERLDELKSLTHGDAQTYLDLAFDYASAGLYEEASHLLEVQAGFSKLYPMVGYTLGWLAQKLGKPDQAIAWAEKAALASPDYCFPWRLDEMIVLQDALQSNPKDTRAAYYLGNLLYDKKQYAKAVALWLKASQGEPGFSIPWRNLGLAAYNLEKDVDTALGYYQKAIAADPGDPRLLVEYDYLLRRKAVAPEERLTLLETKREVVDLRDDLVIHLMGLYNRTGQPEKALKIALARHFHAWEGGEGSVVGEYCSAHWLLGRAALEGGDPATALEQFQAGLVFPDNLGEHPWAGTYVHLIYYKGLALNALAREEEAQTAFEEAREIQGGLSPAAVINALAQIQLGQVEEGQAALKEIKRKAEEEAEKPFEWNYFYSGNPSPTFEEDNQKQQRLHFTLLSGLAAAAMGDKAGARSALGAALAADPSDLAAWEEYRRSGA